MQSWLGDIRFAWRRLLKDPAAAVVAILSCGLGVGASAALFGAVDQVLLSPLPYPAAERLIELEDRTRDGGPLAVAYGTYVELAQRNRSFETLAVADRWRASLLAAGEPERLDGDHVTADYFRVLGIGPAQGRNFEAADDVAGAPWVAIVGAGLAARRFGSTDAAVGRTLVLDGESYTIIGVMPAAFENVLRPGAEVWAPLRFRAQAPPDAAEWGHRLRMVGRLRPGVTLAQARSELDVIARAPIAEFPRSSFGRGLALESLQAAVTSEVRPALLAIFGAVLVLLVIACVNVANILLARALARRGELALRAALGAEQRRIVQQLFAESALIAGLGGTLGVGIAALATRALVLLAPAELPRAAAIGFDARVLGFALAATVGVAVVVGLVPALRAREIGVHASLAAGARVTPPGMLLLRRSLVVVQVALATVLLASAGLLLRSVVQLLEVPLGFDAAPVATMRISAGAGGRQSNEELQRLYERVVDAAGAVPGVAAAALTSQLPLSGDRDAYGVGFESLEGPDPAGAAGAFRYVVTPGWFDTMGIELKRGRLLSAADRSDAAPVVLISESFAARRFGTRDPIGERLRIGPDFVRPDAPWRTVVGVVADVKQTSLASSAPDAFYAALGQWVWVDEEQSLVVRTTRDPAAVLDAVKRAVWSVDPALPIERIGTMPDLLARSEAQRTFALTVFAAFGVAALLLAAVGVYGVVEGRVTERTREIGLRSALGATPAKIAALVLQQGLALTAAGIALGLLAALGATQAIAALLFGVAPFDPATYAAVAALLLAVAFVASYAPAARAARIDPAITLRAD